MYTGALRVTSRITGVQNHSWAQRAPSFARLAEGWRGFALGQIQSKMLPLVLISCMKLDVFNSLSFSFLIQKMMLVILILRATGKMKYKELS